MSCTPQPYGRIPAVLVKNPSYYLPRLNVVSMSFGWSVGDILAAVRLLVQVGQALKDTGGASSDYQQTSLFLEGLGATLQRIQTYSEKHEGQGLLKGLQKDVEAVRDAVNGFRDRIQQNFGPSLGATAQGGWRKISAGPRKVQYGLFVSKEAKELQEKIATPLRSIQMSLGIEALSIISDLQNITIRIPEETSERVKHTIENVLSQRSEDEIVENQRKLFKQVCEWLLDHGPAPDDFHTTSRKLRPGTCEWIFEKSDFQRWMKDVDNVATPPLFWISGNPGAGKSCLATRIIQKTQDLEPVAYFYCDAKDERKRTLLSILRTWVWQILVLFPGSLPNIAVIYDKGTLPTVSNMCEALKLLVQDEGKCLLVLDGLDECEPVVRKELFSILSEVLALYRVLIVSRHERDIDVGITRSTKGVGFGSLRMSESDNEADIKGYLAEEVEDMELGDEDLEKNVLDKLQRNAKGMFLWANLMVQDLSGSGRSIEEYEIALNNLPKTLDDVYGRILNTLNSNSERRDISKKLLQWLACAVRPLTLEELRAALAIGMNEERSNPKKRIPNIEATIRQCCGSLVDIDSTRETTIVRLIHASVKDYLLSTPNISLPYASLMVEFTAAHTYISRCCLTYMCFDDIDLLLIDGNRKASQNIVEQHIKAWPLLDYAALNWSRHLSLARNSPEALMELRRLYCSDINTIKWLQLLSPLRGDKGKWRPSSGTDILDHLNMIRFSELISDHEKYRQWLLHLDGLNTGRFSRWQRFMCCSVVLTCSPVLHIASFFDFDAFGKKLIQEGHSVELHDARGATALHEAARADASNAAKMLLEAKAAIDAKDQEGLTPLVYAMDWEQDLRIRSGPFEVASILIHAGADVCVKDRDPYTSLLRACDIPLPDDEHIAELVTLLLENGATKILNEGAQGTPVGWAGMISSIRLLRIFLASGAYVDAGMGNARNEGLIATPLVKVCELRDAPAIPVLIEAGASVHARDFDRRTSLHKTTRNDSYEASKLLLQHGADVNAVATDGSMPIHEAARENHIDQIRLLIQYHSKLEVEDSTGRTPLDITVDNNSPEAVRLLIEAGANANRRGRVVEATDKQIKLKLAEQGYQPATDHDIFHVYWILTQALTISLPRPVALRIINLSEYYLQSEASRSDYITVTEPDVGPTYLRSSPITRSVKKIVFKLKSHDQGFSDFQRHHGSYNHSYTWFDVAVFDAQGRQVEIEEDDRKIQVNVHASSKTRLHTVVYGQGQHMRQCKWLGNLGAGDVVAVVPIARYPGWVNHVLAARIETYTLCLRD